MATKTTNYLVGERLSATTVWLHCGGPGHASYGWCGDRRQAKRFVGRKDADAAASWLYDRIKADGYQPNRIVVLPASGGNECGMGGRS